MCRHVLVRLIAPLDEHASLFLSTHGPHASTLTYNVMPKICTPHDADGDSAEVWRIKGLAQRAELVQDAAQRPDVCLWSISLSLYMATPPDNVWSVHH